MKLILADNSVITYDRDMGIGDIVASYSTMAQAQIEEAWITPANVAHIQTTTDEDVPVGEYTDLVIISTELVPIEEEEVVTGYELHIHLREKTDVEVLTERVDALEESQDTQDEAIEDLGEAVSEIMEG